MEEYSKLALLLFLPCRELCDIQEDGSFTKRLRMAYTDGKFGYDAQNFLQNMQDTRSNSFRVTRVQDDLQRRTRLMSKDKEGSFRQKIDEDSCSDMEEENMDELIYCWENEDADTDDESCDMDHGWLTPESISFSAIRSKGSERCGYRDLTGMEVGNNPIVPEQFLDVEETSFERQQSQHVTDEDIGIEVAKPTQHDIVKVLVTKTRRRRRTFDEITGNERSVSVLEANGSARSIIDWARKAKLDRGQRRAFEILTSSFVLSFYDDIPKTATLVSSDRHPFVFERRMLELLADVAKRRKVQLVCLLHGPGGSGKTTVIDLVRTYAEEYCKFLEDFEYRTSSMQLTSIVIVTP
jgi:hypothetical protein